MTWASAIYEGRVRHRRYRPAPREFRYGLFMTYLDLAELPELFRGRLLWSAERPALARFRREDHLGDPAVPLDGAVRGLVERETGFRPEGPIRLLTHLRYFGYVMNPVSFYYCWDRADARVEAIVAEVHNTPWGERHPYVLRAGEGDGEKLRFRFRKAFHVSPFLSMDYDYDWRFTEPGERLAVHMENVKDGAADFDATMTLARREITGRSLASALARYPFMTGKVVAAIYWQALRLRLRGVPVYAHPNPQSRIGR